MSNNIIPHNVRYFPHDLQTKFHAVKLYRNGYSSSFICRRYKISKASLSRWNRKFNGDISSLIDKSHKPISKHPNSHTDTEIYWINCYIKRNPHISLCELWGKLKIEKGYSRHPVSLYRLLKKMGFYEGENKPKYTKYIPKPYDTPKEIGVKWQVDVKYVPKECKSSCIPADKKYYQYTCIDEASRERFIFHYEEKSITNSVEFLHRCFLFYGYKPKIVQTDNGTEFVYLKDTSKTPPFTQLCRDNQIFHQTIRPRTPRHNGKVERSHRNDNERFYKYLKFYSLEDLRHQAKLYLKRSNNIPMATLNYLSPIK